MTESQLTPETRSQWALAAEADAASGDTANLGLHPERVLALLELLASVEAERDTAVEQANRRGRRVQGVDELHWQVVQRLEQDKERLIAGHAKAVAMGSQAGDHMLAAIERAENAEQERDAAVRKALNVVRELSDLLDQIAERIDEVGRVDRTDLVDIFTENGLRDLLPAIAENWEAF